MDTNAKEKKAAHFVDITNEICPLTFVKTKLALEKLKAGSFLTIRLKGREPIENVPQAAREHGHKICSIKPEDSSQGKFGIHWLVIQKKE